MSVNVYAMAKENFMKLSEDEPDFDEKFDDIQATIHATDGEICSCGRVVQSRNLKRHKKTQVHIEFFEVKGLDINEDDM